MRLYLVAIGALVLALLLRPDNDAASGRELAVVQAIERRGVTQQLPSIKARQSAIPIELFAADKPITAPPAPPEAEPIFEPPPPPRPEITILGWMQSGVTPHVFVEWRGENHALRPSQELDGTYRFEGIEQGMAEFTYLSDETLRLYRVGDLGSGD
ncbi:hypothetical protein LDO26_01270 [Luteimonas sp. BDR2-5]|uniref:hypothetical protein n=1 Tax=Proluteimonas luteida TaxID=2878685 RepID=UPI001E48E639|nr:hypothetical protein [Luteimonas sp. BDR2-5]MCD9026847.1 hypothetical protein [Luteimonas sp. BDR2-5]